MVTATENQEKNKMVRIAAAIAIAVLMFGSLIYLTVVMGENSRLSDDLSQKMLLTEKLLSEKLSLEKDIIKLKGDIASAGNKSGNLEVLLNEAQTKLKNTEEQLRIAKKDDVKTQLKNQNKKLSAENSALEKQLVFDKEVIDSLRNEAQVVSKKLELLDLRNKALSEELDASRLSSVNDVLIEPAKRNAKLTLNSKRVKAFLLSVNLNEKLKEIKFTILDPSGNLLPVNESNSTVKVIGTNIATKSKGNLQRVQLIYNTKTKLKGGLYTVNVTNNDLAIVSLQVRLN